MDKAFAILGFVIICAAPWLKMAMDEKSRELHGENKPDPSKEK